jgi:YD repeat-containing protein
MTQVVGNEDSGAEWNDLVATFTYTDGTEPGNPPAGLVETETDPLGRVTSYQYNAQGNPSKMTNPDGTFTEASEENLASDARRLPRPKRGP